MTLSCRASGRNECTDSEAFRQVLWAWTSASLDANLKDQMDRSIISRPSGSYGAVADLSGCERIQCHTKATAKTGLGSFGVSLVEQDGIYD